MGCHYSVTDMKIKAAISAWAVEKPQNVGLMALLKQFS